MKTGFLKAFPLRRLAGFCLAAVWRLAVLRGLAALCGSAPQRISSAQRGSAPLWVFAAPPLLTGLFFSLALLAFAGAPSATASQGAELRVSAELRDSAPQWASVAPPAAPPLRGSAPLRRSAPLRGSAPPFFWRAEKAELPALALLGTAHQGVHLESLSCSEEIAGEIGAADLVFMENRDVFINQWIFEGRHKKAGALLLSQIPAAEREALRAAAEDLQLQAQKRLSRFYHYSSGGFEDLSLAAQEYLIRKGARSGENYQYYQLFLTVREKFELWDLERAWGLMDVEVLSLALSYERKIQFLDDLRSDQILSQWSEAHKPPQSSLRSVFLTALPGDVASMALSAARPGFEPPLRAFAAQRASAAFRGYAPPHEIKTGDAGQRSFVDAAFMEDYIKRHAEASRLYRELLDKRESLPHPMISAYKKGEEERMLFLHEEYAAEDPAFARYLIEERNAAWLLKLQALSEGAASRRPADRQAAARPLDRRSPPRRVFLAAGARHFMGEWSLLDMLKDNGYAISRMDGADCSF